MTKSFRRIDYSIRPAKHAERRMLCDVFRRLRPFGRVEDYVYVGFGSVWFSDFSLFHRSLGIREMVSIEHAESAKDRIEENKPFRIPVDYRPSTEALIDLSWERNQFIWLDYDDPLSVSMLLDMKVVARRAMSGTALAVSVQCSKAPEVAYSEQDKSPGAPTALERFVAAFGRERVPPEIREGDLYSWRYGKLARSLLVSEIESELASRPPGSNRVRFDPICCVEYEDGAKMCTIIGLFVLEEDDQKRKDCHFESLDFLQRIPAVEAAANSPTPCVRINVPKLTVREFRRLESQLPLGEGQKLQLGTIPEGEAKTFADMYRYLPNFAVVEG